MVKFAEGWCVSVKRGKKKRGGRAGGGEKGGKGLRHFSMKGDSLFFDFFFLFFNSFLPVKT